MAVDPAKPAKDQLAEHLPGTDLVLIPAGIPRKPGMTRDDLFNVRAAADLHASPEHAKEWWSQCADDRCASARKSHCDVRMYGSG